MLIGTRQRTNHRNVSVHISGQVLTQVHHTKYLGVFIDQHLTWQKHTEFVFQRVRRKVHSISAVSWWAPPIALLSKSMERIHARFVSYKCNDVGFAKVTLAECRHFHTIVQI